MQLLKLRVLQLRRDLSYWVIIIGASSLYLSYSVSKVSQVYSLTLLGAASLFFYTYHARRKDLNFVSRYFTAPRLQICFNYNLIVLPLSLGCFLNGYFLYSLLFHFLISSIAFFDLKSYSLKLLFIGKYIPPQHFEWISGIRKNFHILFPLLLLAIVLSPVKLFGLVVLFIINTIFIDFYTSFEPLIMLNPGHHDLKEFLMQKINFFIKIILILNIPVLCINSIINPDALWFNVCFLMAFLLFASCSVFIKYAHYKPNDSLGFNLDFLILFSSVLMPYLLPLSVYIYFSNKKKALTNLSYYSDDNS